MIMTTRPKIFSCEKCGIAFTQKSHLRTHLIRQPPCKEEEKEDTQDTGKFRTNLKDKFYTQPAVAEKCIKTLLQQLSSDPQHIQWVEPSAGNGSFLPYLPCSSSLPLIALDIEPDPESKEIQQQDYLTWTPPTPSPPSIKTIVIGNPPFGRQSSLAKAFIRKSCSYAHYIAFILPKSFQKPSMYQAFDSHFHLIYSHELEKNSFLLNQSPYDVPCVFQIWEKRDTPRTTEPTSDPTGYHYVKQSETHDMICRRVGAKAGTCFLYDPEKTYSIQSHYFIRFDPEHTKDNDTATVEEIIKRMNTHTFPSNTVGPRSLSKSEVNEVLNQLIQLTLTEK